MNLQKTATGKLIAISLLRVLWPVYQNLDKFTERYDPVAYEKKYNASQYMVPRSKNPISDEVLLSHAGYSYIKGTNPILINSDHPPLGKYFIGIFTVLTGNNRTVSIFFAAVNMALMAAIILLLTRSPLLASLGVLFLSFDPMFVDQIIHSPILDIIQVSFLLVYILILIKWSHDRRNTFPVLAMGIALGCLSSVKLYFPALVVILSTLVALVLGGTPWRYILKYAFIVPVTAFFTYAATYFRYFMESRAFLPFFGVQKWIFLFWQTNSVNDAKVFGNVLPFILFNKWKVWWGTEPYISYSGWTVVWPLFFILGFAASLYFLFMYLRGSLKDNPKRTVILLLTVWLAAFTSYLCFIPISPRYLMMLFFPVYILVTLFIHCQFGSKKHAQ